jgi:hypothetical protein
MVMTLPDAICLEGGLPLIRDGARRARSAFPA